MAIPFALVGSVFSSLLGMGQNRQQMAIAAADLNERRRSAREIEKLAKASRTDAMGNRTYFDGEGFRTDVAPVIQAILDAGSKEQLATLREDAPRARAASERKDARSKGADAAYQRAFAEMIARPQKDEGTFQSEDFFAMLDNMRGQGTAGLIDAVRSGLPSALTTVVKSRGAPRPSLRTVKAATDRSGSQAFNADAAARTAGEMGELQQLMAMADNTDGANPRFSNANAEFSAAQEGALQNLQQAVMQGSNMRSAGMQGVAQANASKKDPFASIFAALESAYGQSAKDAALQREMGEEQLEGMKIGNDHALEELLRYLKQNEGTI